MTLALVPAGIGAGFFGWALLPDRFARASLAAALLIGVAYSGLRLATVRELDGWSVCVSGRCSSVGPWWSRQLPEGASLDAGLLLSRSVGVVSGSEARSYGAAFRAALRDAPSPPNALVFTSWSAHVTALVHEPLGTGPVPAIVLLFGFGGLSTAYAVAFEKAGLGDAYIVAPALDPSARWDSSRGESVVNEVLAELPARVDRSRVVLVGLSNGAIFGARYTPKFKAAVLVSGVGGAKSGVIRVVSGSNDARIPASWLRDGVAELRANEVDASIEIIPGADHGLILTHPDAWGRQVRAALRP